ncbi:MAG: bifunctional acetate--CoA ligase family protein/GNAT family N-acetyltransferase [Chloroflexi bacterium]|nr:bifunctional acetate--CoA ligase family protein/GNAT family N-acetyltransferase [Chloroflexota bacterium]
MEKNLTPTFDPSHDIYHYESHPLDAIFVPKHVAVIGATENPGTVGRTILWNLISNPFGGTVFPVNPKRPGVLGIKAYPSIAAVPEQVDLAVVVTPAPTVPGIIGQCVDAGVKGAIVISAGFKEIGAQGAELERQIMEHRGNMRIIGPNCLGVMSTISGLNATFAAAMARPGNVGFITQSGALATAILDWSFRESVGFSAFVSIGSMLDVSWGDLIYYLGDDPRTQSIVIYMETIGDARAFLSAAREVSLVKPIIVIKPGRTASAARAAASHTGSLTGSDDVLQAAFDRSGVLRVNSIADLFYMAEVLSKQPRPQGPRLTILTNAGGPGVIATDALIMSGGQLAEVSGETMSALNKILPPQWSHNNPIDILGDASPERYAQALELAVNDPNSDGLLVVLTPQAMTAPTDTAEKVKPYAHNTGKPILASWMGGADVEPGEAILNRAGIPTFDYPDTAARMFQYMWQSTDNLRGLYETPILPADADDVHSARGEGAKIINAVRASGRAILTEFESKQLLAVYGIPTVETYVAKCADDAVMQAEHLGYPVVLKLYSETITHKTDVGGVQLNIRNAEGVGQAYRAIETAVRAKHPERNAVESKDAFLGVTVQPMIKLDGYELILGSSIDPQFGPVLLFGAGGQLVEVIKDSALALPPLNTTLARRLIGQTRIFQALQGVRGRAPIDLSALEQLLVRFSQLVVEQPWIKEIDINPLLASPEQMIALDARVVVFDQTVARDQLPRPAIRPYPSRYIQTWSAKNGMAVTFRPIRPEDEPLMIKFHEDLSDRSVYLRYLQPMLLSRRVAHERLARICFVDYDRELALVAEGNDAKTGERAIIAAGRLSRLHGGADARLTMLINDAYQGIGLGKELMRRLLQMGRDEKIQRVSAIITPDNAVMKHLCESMGGALKPINDGKMVIAEIELKRE